MSRGLGRIERFLSRAQFNRAPWLAVAFGGGICAWFALPSAPWWLAWCGLCLGVAGAAMALRPLSGHYPYVFRAFWSVALLLMAGCLTVWARSATVGEVPLARPIAGTFTGRVLEREEQPAHGRDRLFLAMREPGSDRPIRIRVNLPHDVDSLRPGIGAVIRFKARLMPPAPPMLPGAYNFARAAWFSGIVATGTVLKPIEIVEPGPGEGGIAVLRARLARHVLGRIAPGEAGIAAALATGDRGGIAEEDAQAMRDAGLAHLLSISGLHVSAVIGAVYLLALRLLALSPWLALRLRLPVVAAGTGALAGIGYTLLTGAEVPTVRSCIAALLVLAALALGREALSLRMLAVAAFCVLLLWPEAVTGPSFQMSFAAVLAIVALGTSDPFRRFLGPREEGFAMRVLRHLAMLLLTGLVIELALMPIGLYHFHRAGVYGALANVAAIPLTTFVVMPLIAIALALDLLGAGAPAWWLAGHAIDLLMGLAHWIATRPGAVSLMPAMGNGAFLLFVAGGLWLGLWNGPVRLLGLFPAAVGTLMLALMTPPDMLVTGDGRHVGLVGDGGERLFVLRDSRSGYVRDNFSELAGLTGEVVPLRQWPGAQCNRDFCTVPVRRDGRIWNVLIARGRDRVPERALAAACDKADIVIADRWLPYSCRPKWLKADRAMLSRTGGMAIDLAQGRITTVAQGQGAHGWWRPGT
ncbi:ComEC family competence protein [Novosphingobium sp. HK4-1]|uniref:ComEC family competence protein n=1 Tax=Novosphingobium mangrovi (ex Huang et al. 2023) TaxID=2976432 RepID=A0ABT2I3Y7_9SPHN|nr:ComEC/Rec2 family competence protein [Novosphingobium mangrovi (ex Huang et al. 2023)]MCT2399518.1 ComEC family competence protein [Novosphingobium mangrovi (ex Huang et al. 2023)]